jgi:uncharacterized RDD family membrane protein YckC
VSPEAPDQRWPGERLGLPQRGPRSVGRFGRRLAAVAIDWAAVTLVAIAVYGLEYPPFAPLVYFAVVQVLFLMTLGGSPGHVLLGMRVVPVAGGWIGAWRPIVRTLLLCVVIPAAIWDRDQRGLHDRAAGTVLVRK